MLDTMREVQSATITAPKPPGFVVRADSHSASITWTAVIGGAIVVAAVSLILLALGAGLGLSTFSPWSGLGTSAAVISSATIIWWLVMNFISGSLGGYLAGRFRNRWTGIHGDEVYFRDTAHGFLAWGLAFIGTAAFLATAATVLTGGAVASSSNSSVNQENDASAYFTDLLFRTDTATLQSINPATREEVGRILARGLLEGEISVPDKAYAAEMISRNTGIAANLAEQRVTNVFVAEQTAAAKVQKATGHSLLWIFLALLVGAFCASAAATIGGRHRDNVVLAD